MSQCQAGPSAEILSTVAVEGATGQSDSVRFPSQLSRCSMSSESSNCSTTPLVSSKIAAKYSSVQRSYTQLDDNSSEDTAVSEGNLIIVSATGAYHAFIMGKLVLISNGTSKNSNNLKGVTRVLA